MGVVGPSGSGKSTLLEVMVRLRTPESGTITVNGSNVAEVSARSWAAQVALVPQEPRLLVASVADNVRFGRGEITDDEVRAAARAAHVLDEIEALPGGLDARLGPGEGGLSGGQRQRLVLARALVGRPSLIVLDEPTSALDERSEVSVVATLQALRGTATIVIVSHRPSTLSICDRVLCLRDGRLVEEISAASLAADPAALAAWAARAGRAESGAADGA